MTPQFYKPDQTVSGPAYTQWFKAFATLVTTALVVYGASITVRFPVMSLGMSVKFAMLAAAIMLAISYYWFLRSSTTIDARGITQTWVYNRQVEWRDVRGAKMIGIPYLSWLFPPRLLVRTGNSFATFNGGSQALLIEFAKISLAFQAKK